MASDKTVHAMSRIPPERSDSKKWLKVLDNVAMDLGIFCSLIC